MGSDDGLHVLFLVHQENAGGGVFGEVARRIGLHVDERLVPEAGELPSADRYGAVLVFGGSANVGEEEQFPWLARERALLDHALTLDLPILGVCLGAQQLAASAGARVGPIGPFEIGWHAVHATPEAAQDPVLGPLPGCFRACEWHGYGFDLPEGATPLFGNERGWQAFRLGTRQWGIQFHAEVTHATFQGWMDSAEGRTEAAEAGVDLEELRAATNERIEGWNDLGRGLCRRFFATASPARAGRVGS